MYGLALGAFLLLDEKATVAGGISTYDVEHVVPHVGPYLTIRWTILLPAMFCVPYQFVLFEWFSPFPV